PVRPDTVHAVRVKDEDRALRLLLHAGWRLQLCARGRAAVPGPAWRADAGEAGDDTVGADAAHDVVARGGDQEAAVSGRRDGGREREPRLRRRAVLAARAGCPRALGRDRVK